MISNGDAMSQIKQESAQAAAIAAAAFLRITDVVRITALSRATLYRRIADGKFPAPVHLGGRACGWTPVSLQAWIADPQGYTNATRGTAIERARLPSREQ